MLILSTGTWMCHWRRLALLPGRWSARGPASLGPQGTNAYKAPHNSDQNPHRALHIVLRWRRLRPRPAPAQSSSTSSSSRDWTTMKSTLSLSDVWILQPLCLSIFSYNSQTHPLIPATRCPTHVHFSVLLLCLLNGSKGDEWVVSSLCRLLPCWMILYTSH